MIELGSNEGTNRLSGCSEVHNGSTSSLKATTTTERTWGPHGDHNPDDLNTLLASPLSCLVSLPGEYTCSLLMYFVDVTISIFFEGFSSIP